MTEIWLHVVGIGEDGLDGLGATARAAVEHAEVLVGGRRHLAMVDDDGRERLAWPSPFDALVEEIESRRGRRVCVLATGDPCWYGVGATLARAFSRREMMVYPGPSAFSLACARLGWSLSEIDTLSLHGRPVATLHAFVQPRSRLLALANDRSTPHSVADLLVARGYGSSHLVVLEHLGGERERVIETSAADAGRHSFTDFHTLAIECVASPGAHRRSRAPGLPDEAFCHDGQLTKRAIRAATLAVLAPAPGELLWDVGAGCGSIAIEWMRAVPRTEAIAIERQPSRVHFIQRNARALGVPGLEIVTGHCPQALEGLPQPDAVFLGGGLRDSGVFDRCWQSLTPGGRLVVNTVTAEGECALLERHSRVGGELQRLAVSALTELGSLHAFRPSLPVTQLVVTKGWPD